MARLVWRQCDADHVHQSWRVACVSRRRWEGQRHFRSDTMQARPLALNVALLGNDLESDVKRGENSGRKLRHDFVVLQLAKSEMTNQGNLWTGTVLLSSNAATDKATALAAWVKSGENAPPIQATGGWLKP